MADLRLIYGHRAHAPGGQHNSWIQGDGWVGDAQQKLQRRGGAATGTVADATEVLAAADDDDTEEADSDLRERGLEQRRAYR